MLIVIMDDTETKSDHPPPSSMSEKAKSMMAWLNAAKGFIMAMAALVVAIGSMLKPPDTKVTKATYDELSSAVEQIAKDVEANHDDMTALRAWIAGRDGLDIPNQVLTPNVQQEQPSQSVPRGVQRIQTSSGAGQRQVAARVAASMLSAAPPAPAAISEALPPPQSPRPSVPALRGFEALTK